jgi:NADH dehydrogenase
MEVTIADLRDPRGVRAALVGVENVIHLASAEASGNETELQQVDVQGTAVLASAAEQAKVRRMIFASHLGAELSSAYPVLRAKALAEQSIRRSAVPTTVLRSSLAYGPGDRFTRPLAMLLSVSPLLFPLPGDGSTAVQPIWIDDLITCIEWALDDSTMAGKTIEFGGAEFVTLTQLVRWIQRAGGSRRWVVHTSPAVVRGLTWLVQHGLPRPPVTTFLLDYLATSRMTSLDSLTRVFGLKPVSMEQRLDYLRGTNWGWELLRAQFGDRA